LSEARPPSKLAESARAIADAAHRASRGTFAAIVTLLAGIVIGEIGFLRFAQQAASANNTLMLEIAGRQASGTMGGQDVSVAAPVALGMLSSITFAIGTPVGWLSTYLVVTGLVRSVAAAVGERRGDPIVGVTRRLLARWRGRRRASHAEAVHAQLAGPEVADRVVEAGRVGIAGAHLVVVAWRPKPDWTPGTVLDCGDRWLRVGDAVQRTLPVGLRTLYPLVEVPGLEVFRRIVRYDLPSRVE
jgi:hypothetical protein